MANQTNHTNQAIKKRFFCIDAHTCGNPVRVVINGHPVLRGNTMEERRQDFLHNHDWIRKSLMFEPRGHDMMSGSFIYPSIDPCNDISVLFIETSGCLPMCGHGLIGTITIGIEEGIITPKILGKVRVEAPAGLIEVDYIQESNGKVSSVTLTNIPSFLYLSDINIQHSDLGTIKVDIAYGGNFYAIVEVQDRFSGLQTYNAETLIKMSREIRTLVNQTVEVVHPLHPTISGCSHVLWTGATLDPSSTARNAVFYGDKAIDRSPCGTGTSARMAQWHAQGKLKQGDLFFHESIIGSKFVGEVKETTTVGNFPAIVPKISGWAKIYGYNNILCDELDDPYAMGFQVV